MYTTSQVAEQLQLTNKKVLLFSKKGNLELEKSNNGYLFTDEQIEQIKEIYEESIQVVESKQMETDNIDLIRELTQKLIKLEEKVETKANEVVSVQILEHRCEIEDLKKVIGTLENQVDQLNEQVTLLKADLEDQKKILTFKPKKRFAILSIFGV
ncbi:MULTISPECIES: MerR family transcriptional regulator [unclassified Bacillus (in: firmicutes)]|uniref:MerR family transcriptional regulator n=1 Tax=unclassified Bacillus (in: firmicutes) TaxID=185979 RepID=UPI0015CF6395|nr:MULTISPECIES: MerR family transcriptional regulator [unclassified Bacillus (in: firmicutes)]